MEDTTDANGSWFSFLLKGGNKSTSGSDTEVISGKIPVCYKMADFYNVKHKKRGIALIFNHEYFDDPTVKHREGTNIDKYNLEKIFTKLDFDVRIYDDRKYAEISKILKDVSKEDHSEHDCFLVCVMSHGEDGKINSRDHAYRPDILWETFSGCVTLAGKPKMFFIQACRGSKVDDGIQVRNSGYVETDSGPLDETYVIPAMADILVMYSTYQGYYAWRSPDKGSWFIQALCHELEEKHGHLDLLTILTFVNRRVALLHESNVVTDKSFHKKKQVCSIVSMLTRLFAFVPKRNLMELEESVEGNNDSEMEVADSQQETIIQ